MGMKLGEGSTRRRHLSMSHFFLLAEMSSGAKVTPEITGWPCIEAKRYPLGRDVAGAEFSWGRCP